MTLKREDPCLIRVKREGAMKIDAFIFARHGIPIDDKSVAQLKDAAALPTVEHALGMPDIHAGYGVPIGSVVATREVIVPAAVGYDVNCGMRLILTSLRADEVDVKKIADSIRRDIPLGEGKSNVEFSRGDLEAVLAGGLAALAEQRHSGHRVWDFFDPATERESLRKVEDAGSMEGDPAATPKAAIERGLDQLGTLGGGNHFIELQVVDRLPGAKYAERFGLFEGQLAIMVHSGSRGLGHEVGGHFMKLARQGQEGQGGAGRELAALPLDAKAGRDYLGAMRAAANYAFANRALMAALAVGNLHRLYPSARSWLVYDVPHNIAKAERHEGRSLWVHRKGATRAFGRALMKGTDFQDVGQPVLIPGSMGTASYLLLGLDSGARSLFSVSHGAGRTMSRTQAGGGRGKGKRDPAISDAEFEKSMEGIYLVAESRRGAKEEAPAAYKDIDLVIATIAEAELALPVARFRPRAVLKG